MGPKTELTADNFDQVHWDPDRDEGTRDTTSAA
jgi:hypothetical protein